MVNSIVQAGDEIAEAYEAREFSRAMRLIMACADKANEYIDDKKPWSLNKIDGKQAQVQAVCTVALNIFRQLMVYLAPVLPIMTQNARQFFKRGRIWICQPRSNELLLVALPTPLPR